MGPESGCQEHFIHVKPIAGIPHTENVVKLMQERSLLGPIGFNATQNLSELLVTLYALPRFLHLDPGQARVGSQRWHGQ